MIEAPPVGTHKGRGQARRQLTRSEQKVDSQLAPWRIMVNAFTAIGLAIASLVGGLWMLFFEARLRAITDLMATKLDHAAVVDIAREYARELKEDNRQNHQENKERLGRLETTHLEIVRSLGRIESALRVNGAK